MPDVHDQKTRSRNMAAIQSKNTGPELLIRSGLHQLGFRFRLNDRPLAGKPDLVLKKYNAVIFVHGCFWHKHDCHLFKWPKTREQFWRNKIGDNAIRDAKVVETLTAAKWRVGIIWECALKGRTRLELADALISISNWLRSDAPRYEIRGNDAP